MIFSFQCECQKLHNKNTAMLDPKANTINVSSVHQMKTNQYFWNVLYLQYDKTVQRHQHPHRRVKL
jgi:hypothetical protein